MAENKVPVQPADNTAVQTSVAEPVERKRQSQEDLIAELSKGESAESADKIRQDVRRASFINDLQLVNIKYKDPELFKLIEDEVQKPESDGLTFNQVLQNALRRNGFIPQNGNDGLHFVNKETGKDYDFSWWGGLPVANLSSNSNGDAEYKRSVGNMLTPELRKELETGMHPLAPGEDKGKRAEEYVEAIREAANPDNYNTEDYLQRVVDKNKPRRMTKTLTHRDDPIGSSAMPGPDAYDVEGGSDRLDRNETAEWLDGFKRR